MTNENNMGNTSTGIKKLVLPLPPRVRVDTTQGTYFARHMSIGDLKSFGEYFDEKREKTSTDLRALGERLLKVLVCFSEEGEKTPALTDEIYSKLTADDFKALAGAVGKACQATFSSDAEPVEALGSAVFDMTVDQARRLAESSNEIKRTLDSSFGSISEKVKIALGENMAGLSAIREGLKMSSAVEAVRKAQKEQAEFFRGIDKEVTGASAAADAIQKAPYEHERVLGTLTSGQTASHERSSRTPFRVPDLPQRLPHMLRDEETPMGRAAIAGETSALQLQEVAGLVGQMTEQLGAMHELFLIKVVPQWVQNLKESGKAAGTSIGLAKQAIYWSIAVTIAMTLLQLGVAHYYRAQDDEQQRASKAFVQRQLDVSLEFNQQLAADSKRLQEELAKLSQAVSTMQVLKASPSVKLKNDKTRY